MGVFGAAGEAALSNPAGPRIAYGSSLRLGRSPSISPGTSSTRRTPEAGTKTSAHVVYGNLHSQCIDFIL